LKRPLSISISTTIIVTSSIARYSNGGEQPPLSVDLLSVEVPFKQPNAKYAEHIL